jgi:hypothetical protein
MAIVLHKDRLLTFEFGHIGPQEVHCNCMKQYDNISYVKLIIQMTECVPYALFFHLQIYKVRYFLADYYLTHTTRAYFVVKSITTIWRMKTKFYWLSYRFLYPLVLFRKLPESITCPH